MVEGVTDTDMDAPDLDAAIEDADGSQLLDSADEEENLGENDVEGEVENGNGENRTLDTRGQRDDEEDLDEGVEEPQSESEEESEEDSVEDASGNESNGGMEVE